MISARKTSISSAPQRNTRLLPKHQHQHPQPAPHHDPNYTEPSLFSGNLNNSHLPAKNTIFAMAGGKGKSSGGKSSGGKVGVDGSKKQQSHSSKAGLQVSICAFLLFSLMSPFSGGLGGWKLQGATIRLTNTPPYCPCRVTKSQPRDHIRRKAYDAHRRDSSNFIPKLAVYTFPTMPQSSRRDSSLDTAKTSPTRIDPADVANTLRIPNSLRDA